MDFILDHLNARSLLVVGAAVAAIVLGDRYQEYPRRWYENWRYPPARGASPLAADISRDLDARESLELRALHRRVSLEIAQAQAKGFDVGRLQALADNALKLDAPAYRAAAIERLNRLRLAIPQTAQPLRPATEEDEPRDEVPTPKARRARRAGARPSGPGARPSGPGARPSGAEAR